MADPDYIVVGAGSAGCVVARRLAARDAARVLLIEAGTAQDAARVRRPAEYPKLFGGDSDWDYRTEASPQLAGRRLRWPRGRGPGGSTRINAMIWMRPTAADLLALQAAGGEDWNPVQTQADLQAVEDWVRPERPPWMAEASRRFLQSAVKISDGPHPHAYLRMNRRGQRLTADDLLDHQSAAIARRTATAEAVVLEGDRAVGIRVRRSSGSEILLATKGVVLCTGAIATPLLLMRSGIGPPQMLRELGIPVRIECAAVGCGLADHLVVPVIWATPSAGRFPAAWTMADLARWQHGGTGPLASNLAEVGGLMRCGRGAAASPIQLHVTPTDYLRHPAADAPAAMTIGVTDPRPASRGRLALRSPDGSVPPRIEPMYLSDPGDVDRLLAGIELAREIAGQTPLAGWLGEEQLPGTKRSSAALLRRFVARYAQTLYHPVGSCALGLQPAGSVVDSRLAVRQTQRLWIADGSVLPEIPSVNPNATIMMLAYRLAGWLP